MMDNQPVKKLHKQRGIAGEMVVINHLIANGFIIRAHNYMQRCGEIDIIAQKGDLLSFIEVKMRTNPLFDMSSLIPYSKQKKIITTAKLYCAQQNIIDLVCRFDVALVRKDHENKDAITIIENAFTESAR